MNKLKKAGMLVLILAITLFMAAGCGGHEPGDGHGEAVHADDDGHGHGEAAHESDDHALELSEQQSEEFGIVVEQAAGGVLTRRIRLPGEVRLNEDHLVHVVPRLPGVVRKVKSSLGDNVTAGQVMAEIESWELAEAAAEHVAATIRLELAEATFGRERDLYLQKITSLEDFLTAKQKMIEARIQMEKAEQKHKALDLNETDHGKGDGRYGLPSANYQISAPMNGTVIDKHISLGEVLKADTEAFLLADLSTVWIDLSIYQKDLPFVRQGETVKISAGHGIPEVEAAIDYLGPLVGEATRTALARVVLENIDGLWRPGLFVTARIDARSRPVKLMVKNDAVQEVHGEPAVFVREGHGYQVRHVAVGGVDEIHTEIVDGLAPGETYVTQGAFLLKAQLTKAAFGDGHNH
jgi:membrane fusion protein, heavy metal efflux system